MCEKENEKKCGCMHPENLKKNPAECTPEQIKECHGDIKDHPCVPPHKGHPSECTPEQIKQCHGDVKDHPCVKPDKEQKA